MKEYTSDNENNYYHYPCNYNLLLIKNFYNLNLDLFLFFVEEVLVLFLFDKARYSINESVSN